MKIVVAATLLAVGITASTVGVAAAAQAAPNICFVAAKRYRHRFDYEPPPFCWGSAWFRSSDGQHWDRPLPFGQDQGTRPPPPAPPSDVPPPPPGEDDEPPPPPAS